MGIGIEIWNESEDFDKRLGIESGEKGFGGHIFFLLLQCALESEDISKKTKILNASAVTLIPMRPASTSNKAV